LYAGDADQGWMVGDRLEDEKVAETAGINFTALPAVMKYSSNN